MLNVSFQYAVWTDKQSERVERDKNMRGGRGNWRKEKLKFSTLLRGVPDSEASPGPTDAVTCSFYPSIQPRFLEAFPIEAAAQTKVLVSDFHMTQLFGLFGEEW